MREKSTQVLSREPGGWKPAAGAAEWAPEGKVNGCMRTHVAKTASPAVNGGQCTVNMHCI